MTASLIRCLLAVLALSDTFERVASKDVAHLLGVRKPTIHNTLLALQERGLIDKERYGDVHLTDEGLAAARRLERQRDDLAGRNTDDKRTERRQRGTHVRTRREKRS